MFLWTYLKTLIEFGLIAFLKLSGIFGRYYNLIQWLLNNRQRVVLNVQSLKWSLLEAGVPQGSILGQLLFLVYINDLPHKYCIVLRCNAKLFAGGTSLFLTITIPVISSSNLNENLRKTTQWTYQWKLSFNPDIIKKAQEIIFSRKKMIQIIQICTLTKHEYNDDLFKNIFVSF